MDVVQFHALQRLFVVAVETFRTAKWEAAIDSQPEP